MPRVLIVEDDLFIAFDLADQLIEATFDIAGIAVDNRRALRCLALIPFDVAVLDINLGAETSEPTALALFDRGIPFLVLSASLDEALPEVLKDAPKLAKPAKLSAVIETLRQLTS